MANKILLITGTSYIDQEKILEFIIKNDANFVRLDQREIFIKVVREISDEYFSKDISLVDKITGKYHLNYLHLLFFLQKTLNKKLSPFFSVVNGKSQLVNEIIIFRLYKEYFVEIKKIIASGKNCIFIENIFQDPFPRRKDIFFDYFKYFGDDLITLNVYTSLKTSILQTKVINREFIKYICSKKNVQNTYKKLVCSSTNDAQSISRLENPLANFESHFLMFNICKNRGPGKHEFESMTGKELKMIYDLSVLEIKKHLGFVVLKSYPTFYQKTSILNEIGSQFLYIKEFKDKDQLYITNKRLSFDYNLNIESPTAADQLNKFLLSYFNSNPLSSFNHEPPQKESHEKAPHPVKQQNISKKTIQKIKDLLNSDRVFFINSSNDGKIDYFGADKNLIFKTRLEYFFFLLTNKGWAPYVLLIQKNMEIKLYHQTNTTKDEENLIFINNLYIKIHKTINRHLFINTFSSPGNSKKRLLKKIICLLHNEVCAP